MTSVNPFSKSSPFRQGVDRTLAIPKKVKGRLLPEQQEIQTPEAAAPISPTPQPVPGREEEEAKKKARKRRGGRESNIFAGRLMQRRQDTNSSILKTRLG